jgi:hypothetical protein
MAGGAEKAGGGEIVFTLVLIMATPVIAKRVSDAPDAVGATRSTQVRC